MKVTKKIHNTVKKFMEIKEQERKLWAEIYEWIDKQGIDHHTDEFADAITVRLGNNEFDSADEFFEDVERFKNDEDVGYG